MVGGFSLFNVLGGIAQSREIMKLDSNPVTPVLINERLKIPNAGSWLSCLSNRCRPRFINLNPNSPTRDGRGRSLGSIQKSGN